MLQNHDFFLHLLIKMKTKQERSYNTLSHVIKKIIGSYIKKFGYFKNLFKKTYIKKIKCYHFKLSLKLYHL